MGPWNVDLSPLVWVIVAGGIGVLTVRFTIGCGERFARRRAERWRAVASVDAEYPRENDTRSHEKGAKGLDSSENK